MQGKHVWFLFSNLFNNTWFTHFLFGFSCFLIFFTIFGLNIGNVLSFHIKKTTIFNFHAQNSDRLQFITNEIQLFDVLINWLYSEACRPNGFEFLFNVLLNEETILKMVYSKKSRLLNCVRKPY